MICAKRFCGDCLSFLFQLELTVRIQSVIETKNIREYINMKKDIFIHYKHKAVT